MNYALEQVPDQTFIYKKSSSDLVVIGGYFYIDGQNIIISNLDTSLAVPNKVLINDSLNYIYVVDGDYKITNVVITSNAYLVGTVLVSVGGNITTITRTKCFGVASKGETGTTGIQGVAGPTGPIGPTGNT